MKKMRNRKRRPTFDEVAEARQYPRRNVEVWINGHLAFGDLCERFGFAGQSAQFFRDEIRRAVTDIVIRMDDALAGRRPE